MQVQNVVIGSSYLWHNIAKLSIHALGRYFLQRSCRVEWFTIPLSPLHFVKPALARTKAEHLRCSLRPVVERNGPGYLVNRVPWTALHPVPRKPLLDSYWLSRSYLSLRLPPLATLAARDGISPVDMLCFDAGGINIYYPFKNKARVRVYRVNDLVAEFPNQVRGRTESEREIIRRADLLLPSSPSQCDAVVEIRGSATGVHLVPNGVEIDLFTETQPMPPEYAAIPAPRAVFAGSMGGWFNRELVCAVARLRPGISFCLVGPAPKMEGLPSNVFYLGPRPHEQIPAYLQHASVGLIPFLDLPRIHRVERPLKFYEYLASGLPIASVPYGSLIGMAPYAFFGASPAEFAEAIDRGLAITAAERERYKQEARRFSWEAIYQQLDSILKQEGIGFA